MFDGDSVNDLGAFSWLAAAVFRPRRFGRLRYSVGRTVAEAGRSAASLLVFHSQGREAFFGEGFFYPRGDQRLDES